MGFSLNYFLYNYGNCWPWRWSSGEGATKDIKEGTSRICSLTHITTSWSKTLTHPFCQDPNKSFIFTLLTLITDKKNISSVLVGFLMNILFLNLSLKYLSRMRQSLQNQNCLSNAATEWSCAVNKMTITLIKSFSKLKKERNWEFSFWLYDSCLYEFPVLHVNSFPSNLNPLQSFFPTYIKHGLNAHAQCLLKCCFHLSFISHSPAVTSPCLLSTVKHYGPLSINTVSMSI